MRPVRQLGLLKSNNPIFKSRSPRALLAIFISVCVIYAGSWALGAEPRTNQVKSAGAPNKSVLRKFETPELDDPGLRDYLRTKLTMAERQRAQIDERIAEYKDAIRELDERIAHGPSASERFASMFEKYLKFARQRAPGAMKDGVQSWTMELNALLDALRGVNPDGVGYFKADFTLTPAHAALEIKGVKVELLLPYAKREIANSPTATELHGKYLRSLIACASDEDEDGEKLKSSLRYFELQGMERQRMRFKAEVEALRNTIRQNPAPALPKSNQGTTPDAVDGDRNPADDRKKPSPPAPTFE